MPTYEYECENCKDVSEHFQSITAAPLTVCEKCGGALVRLLSGGTGLIFKGSGFYITDYKSGGGSGSGGASGKGAGNDGGGKSSGGGNDAGKSGGESAAGGSVKNE